MLRATPERVRSAAAAHNAGVDAAFLRRDHRADASPEPTPTHGIASLWRIDGLL